MKRNTIVGLVLGGMVAAAAGGWALGTQIRSPAELAAAAAAPTASNITVEVVRQALSADIVTRGDVVYDEPMQLTLSGSFADQPETLVVTSTAEVDDVLDEGDVAVEVVGRPVLVLQGDIPPYRDLRPGSTGIDVLQLEQALDRLGHLEGSPDETFDAGTSAALAAWYQELGYVANGISADDDALRRAARERVRSAEVMVAELSSDGEQSMELQARSEVDAAVSALELARLDAQRANRQAARDRDAAKADRDDARSRLAAAEKGKHPDTGEPANAAELSELRREVRDADARHDDAVFEVDRTAKEQASMISQAEDRIAIARAAVADLERGGGDGGADAAAAELAEARDELASIEANLGTWLPAGEFAFLPSLPVRVDQVSTARGSIAEGTLLTLSGSELALRTSVLQRDASLVSAGMTVQIDDPDGGPPIEGTITEVADRAGTHNLAADRVYVEVEPAELPSEMIGQNVRITIPVSSTDGEVLAVPAAALSATASGQTIVQVEDADGTLRTVEVETGLATGGLVEVKPVSGELDEGDLVVVGREDGGEVDIDEVGSDDGDLVEEPDDGDGSDGGDDDGSDGDGADGDGADGDGADGTDADGADDGSDDAADDAGGPDDGGDGVGDDGDEG